MPMKWDKNVRIRFLTPLCCVWNDCLIENIYGGAVSKAQKANSSLRVWPAIS